MSDVELVQLKGGETVSLAELAGFDFDAVEAKRQFQFPVGLYKWEIVSDPEPPKITKAGEKAAAVFYCKCTDIVEVKDPKEAPNGDPAQLLGKNHREAIFLTDPDSFGYLKAFLIDIGVQGKGNFGALTEGSLGLKFTAPIMHRKDKDDPDRVYVSLNRSKIVPEVKRAA